MTTTTAHATEIHSHTLVAERRTGTRTICGTDWTILNQIHREQHGRRVRWIVTFGLCNGTALRACSYRTKREALAAY